MKKLVFACVITLFAALPILQAQNRFTVKKTSTGHYDIFDGTTQVGHLAKFYENVGVFKLGEYYGAIDPAGNVLFDFRFDRLERFSEGLAYYMLKKDNEIGYMDKDGNVVLCWDYAKLSGCLFGEPFHEGMAAIQVVDGYAYIDRNGEVISNDDWNCAYDFSEGLAGVGVRNKQGDGRDFVAFVDKTGRYVVGPMEGVYVGPFKNGKAKIKVRDDAYYNYYYVYKNGKLEYHFSQNTAENSSLVDE